MATAYSLLSRFRTICTPASRVFANRTFSVRHSQITQLRNLVPVSEGLRLIIDCRSAAGRCFSTRSTTSSIQDPSPNWSNRPPKETILLDGCDFEHWLVVVEKPDEKLTRDEIIDSYIKTLAQVVGSEEEARMKIYSVSTKHYFAFGALVSEELSYKIKALPGVRWVLPDSYLNVKEKDYGGEPFIDGQAVPYDPKYHEEWVRNNSRANERNRRPDRPRNFDRSRNFERRRENMQSREYQSREAPPMPNFQNAASPTQSGHNVPPQNSPNPMPSNPNSFSNQAPNAQPGYGYQTGPPQSAQPSGQGYQSGPPSGHGFQAGVMGNQGYQAGPPGIQGYQAGATGSQGYQSGPPNGQGYQVSPPGGQGYLASPPGGQGYRVSPPGGQGYQASQPGGQGYQSGPPVGQAYQAGQSVSQGYQAGLPRNPMYPVGQPSSSTPYYGGNQASQGGPTGGGGPASSQGNFGSTNYLNGSPSNQGNGGNGAYNQGGGNGGFQGGQPGASAYQGGNPPNAARDIPGRDI
ncbi:multiple organellar RNA editing factor 8, chloroplastic/mitochondrial-like [Dendrobium catenatum]|uniref:MORF/ORRM1/DAG-like MORF domain-containing protein n=1 Tax=Dendrobium catenatum TaxID=906689 RepID=A0A2I0W2B4_9ASPA|nr:multiple organellar RNA editing factor 8, chloroplastic/mitochondrial-like [Dendrobium catenatum]PKU69791.1 Uncharacterized protein MA16_Dca019067 [Dendrobium catenatum]